MSGISNQIPYSTSTFYENSSHQFGCTFADRKNNAVHAMRLFYEFSGLKGLKFNFARKDTEGNFMTEGINSTFEKNLTEAKISEEVYRCSNEIFNDIIKSIRNRVVPQPQAFLSSYATSYSQTSISNIEKSNTTSKCVTAQMTSFSPMSMLYAVLVPVPIPCLLTQQFHSANKVTSPLPNCSNSTIDANEGLGEEIKVGPEFFQCQGASSHSETDGASRIESPVNKNCKDCPRKVFRRKDASRQLVRSRDLTARDFQFSVMKSCRTTYRRSTRPRMKKSVENDDIKRDKIELVFYVKRARDQDGKVLYTSDESSSSDSEEEPIETSERRANYGGRRG